MQPGAGRKSIFFGYHSVGFAGGLGQKCIGGRDHFFNILIQPRMFNQLSQMGSGEVHVGNNEYSLSCTGKLLYPVNEDSTGNQHGVFHDHLIVGHFFQQCVIIGILKDLHQKFAHKKRITGFVVDEIGSGLRPMSALDGISLLLNLMPVPLSAMLFCKFSDIPGYRQFHQVGIVNSANEKGIKEIKGDHFLVPRFSSSSINHCGQ